MGEDADGEGLGQPFDEVYKSIETATRYISRPRRPLGI